MSYNMPSWWSRERFKKMAARQEAITSLSERQTWQPSADFIDFLSQRWQKGRKAFIMHRRPDPDEIKARFLVLFTERGRELFPGATLETPILYTKSPDNFKDELDGTLPLGVHDGINEHRLPFKYQQNECCVTMTRKVVGLAEDDPIFAPIIKPGILDDMYASAAQKSASQFTKRDHRFGMPTAGVVNWATERDIQWLEELKLGAPFTVEQANPATIKWCVDFAHSLPNIHDNPRFEPILKAVDMSHAHEDDSLMKMVIRESWLGIPYTTTQQWFAEKVQQWQQDLVNSSPENMWPEMERAAQLEEMEIDGQKITLAIINTAKVSDPRYSEHLAKFARWEKGWNTHLIIQHDAKGNVQIFPNKKRSPRVEIWGVAYAVVNFEGERWHFQFGVLLNGSLKHDRPATLLKTPSLKYLLKEFAWLQR